jgi:hypothetical protein
VQAIRDGRSCAGDDPKIVVENAHKVRSCENRTEFECELRGLGSRGELASLNGDARFTFE